MTYRLVVLLFCAFGANALTKLHAIFQEHALQKGSECLSEGIGATEDDLKAVIKWDIPTTRARMCLLACIHEKFGVQAPNGKISMEGCMAFLELINDDPAYYDATKEQFLHCIESEYLGLKHTFFINGTNMKFLVFISAVVAIATCIDEDFLSKANERMAKTVEECTASVGATKDDLMELMEIRIPSSKEAKCVLACYHKKYGIQDEGGKLDKATAMEAMKGLKVADPDLYDKAAKLFDICVDQVPNQDCECQTAAIFMYCFNIHGAMMDLKPGMVPM
ncbi:putative odorant binding protein [Trypoxylus dichotomus]